LVGVGEAYFGYGPEVEYDLKREYSAVVMIAVSTKAVKLISTPCRAISGND
jgi:hypothetical protein